MTAFNQGYLLTQAEILRKSGAFYLAMALEFLRSLVFFFLEWQPAASPLQRTSKRPQQFLALSGKLGRKYANFL